MSMLTTIYLGGELGQLFGRKWKLRVASPGEALRAIEANRPGLAAYLARSTARGVDWRIKLNGEAIGEDLINFQRPGAVVRISPVVRGAKDEMFGIILGVALVAFTWGAGAGLLGTGLQGFVQTGLHIGNLTVGSLIGGIGISLALGGIAQLLTPTPDQPSSDPGKPSYVFGGPTNVTQQGGPVPLCYGGPIIIGSTRISAGVYSEQIAADQLPKDDELPGPDPKGEGGFSVDPALVAYDPTSPTPDEKALKSREVQTLQIARVLDLLCEGEIAGFCDEAGTVLAYNQRLKATFFDRTPVRNADGALAFTKFATAARFGTATQQWMPGFPSAEQEVSVNQEVIHGEDRFTNSVQRQISSGNHDAVRVSIRLPSLYEYDDKGNRNGAIVHVTIQAKKAADSEWKQIVGHSESQGEIDGLIAGEAVQELIMNYRLPLSGADTWDIRVIRETEDAEDPAKLANRTFWAGYTLVTDRKLRYPHSVIAGTEISAERFQSIPDLAWRVKGKLVRVPSNYDPDARSYTGTWDGTFAGCDIELTAGYTAGGGSIAVSATDASLPDNALIEIRVGSITYEAHLIGAHASGSTSLAITPIPVDLTSGATGYAFRLKWTNNPAWVFYDLLVARRYGLGNYLTADQVDKWALYGIARYCDGVDNEGNFVGVDDGNGGFEPRFACNLYIADAQEAYRVLQDLASVFRGMVFWGAGTITATQDAPKSPVFLFTDANVIDGAFNYSGSSRKSRHSLAMVAFNDPANFFAQDFEVVEDPALIDRFGIREVKVTAFGCTSRSQANRVGRWLLTTERLETQTVTFKTTIEGARMRLGDLIEIRDRYKTVNRMGGRIRTVDAVNGTITVDSEVELSAAEHTILVALESGGVRELTVTNGAGLHQVLNVTGSLEGVVPPGVWILRNENVEPFTARVIEIKEDEDHLFEVTALEYVAGKFAEVEDGVTAEEPPTSDLPTDVAPSAPTSLQINEIVVETPSGTQRQLYVSWAASTSDYLKGYLVEVRAPGRDWETVADRHKPTTIGGIQITSLGSYAVRVRAISYSLVLSAPLSGTYTAAEVTAPDPCTSLTATAGPELIDLRWTNPDDVDLLTVEVFESETSDIEDAVLIQSLLATRYVRSSIPSGAQRWYWVRAVNRSRLRSTYTGPATATATPGPVAALEAADEALLAANGRNRIYRQTTAPDPELVLLIEGDLWFDSDDGNRIYRWTGAAWDDVQRVIDATDFGTGIEPIRIVDTLPSSGNYKGKTVFLTTDNKFYRWTNDVIGTGTDYWTTEIDGADILAGSIVAAKIAAGAITADTVGTNQIITTAANILDAVITGAKIGNAEIGTAKIADLAVTTVKIGTQAVTIPISNYTAGGVTVSTSWTSSISASINSTGAPIFITFGAGLGSFVSHRILRNGSEIMAANSGVGVGCFRDTPGVGTFTYEVQYKTLAGSTTADARCILILETKK